MLCWILVRPAALIRWSAWGCRPSFRDQRRALRPPTRPSRTARSVRRRTRGHTAEARTASGSTPGTGLSSATTRRESRSRTRRSTASPAVPWLAPTKPSVAERSRSPAAGTVGALILGKPTLRRCLLHHMVQRSVRAKWPNDRRPALPQGCRRGQPTASSRTRTTAAPVPAASLTRTE